MRLSNSFTMQRTFRIGIFMLAVSMTTQIYASALDELMQNEKQQDADVTRNAQQSQSAAEERLHQAREKSARTRAQWAREEQARQQRSSNQIMGLITGVINVKAAQQQAQRDAEQAAIIGRGRAVSESLGHSSSGSSSGSGDCRYQGNAALALCNGQTLPAYDPSTKSSGVQWDTGKPYVPMTKEERDAIGKGPSVSSGATR